METLQKGLNDLMTANGLSPKEKTVLEKFIAEVARIARGFMSDLFRFDVTRTVEPAPQTFTINQKMIEKDFFAPIKEREEKASNPEPWLDPDTWKYWDGMLAQGFSEKVTFSIYRFLKQLSHRAVLDEGEKQMIKKVYSFTEAKEIIRTAIFAGDVDQKGTGVFVYFKVAGNDTLYRWHAFRYGDGQLDVNVFGVDLAYEWRAGYGVCFGN